jgi:hypothetical protein
VSIQNMNNVTVIKSGDTFTEIHLLLLNENGTDFDVGGKSIVARFRGQVDELIEKEVTVNSEGHVVIQFTAEDYSSLGFGIVRSEVVVTDGEDIAIFPNDSYFEFEVTRNSKQRSTIH